MTAEWRRTDSLGRNCDSEWTVWEGRSKKGVGYSACRGRAAKWDPVHGICVGRPGEINILPLVSVQELRPIATNAYMRRMQMAILFYGALLVILIVLAKFVHQAESLYVSAAIVFILLCVVSADLRTFSKNPDSLVERARFICWLRRSPSTGKGAVGFMTALVCIGIIQWWYAEIKHDTDAAILAIGMIYDPFRNGEWWRALTGPYIHSNWAHLFANIATGSIFFAILVAMWGWFRATFTFVLSNVVAALFQYQIGMAAAQGMSGVSGGVFGLCGFTLGATLRNSNVLPRGAWVPLLGTAALSVPFSIATGSKVAVHAHWAGFLAGVALGALLGKKRSNGDCI